MSARILSKSAEIKPQAMPWQVLGDPFPESAPEPEPPAAHQEAEPLPSQPLANDAVLEEHYKQQLADLERQLVELEADLPIRAEQARHEGYQAGLRDGEARMRARYDTAIDRHTQALTNFLEYRTRFRAEAERELVKLSLAVAKKILRRETNIDPGALLGIVKAAIESVERQELLALRMHPEEAALVRSRNLLPPELNLVADAALPLGSIVLETQRGQVDASLSTQLDEIERGLSDLLKA